ncbi:hypothetical protein F4805DRAFT_476520 [Annulohypoxylon moriforme]|nr:hypothetical protein F4805DRAFT_476520 [Annulohypoxylon moriforme]
MSLTWANWERESIRKISLHNTGQITQPSPFQEFGIELLTDIMDGSKDVNNGVVEEIFERMANSGQPLEDAWEEFYPLIFSAAMYTSDDHCQKNLAYLVTTLAHSRERRAITKGNKDEAKVSEAEDIFSDLTGFGWMARDYWNGPGPFLHAYGSREAAQRAWVNLNRFMAHLSCEQRKDPADPLDKWVEDFGLWTVTEGLEDREGVKEWAEAGAVWLIVAGKDIYSDPAWGRRNGHKSPGIPLREGPIWNHRLADVDALESRWEFWKSRLQDLTEQALDASAGTAAQEALTAIKRYESSD